MVYPVEPGPPSPAYHVCSPTGERLQGVAMTFREQPESGLVHVTPGSSFHLTQGSGGCRCHIVYARCEVTVLQRTVDLTPVARLSGHSPSREPA